MVFQFSRSIKGQIYRAVILLNIPNEPSDILTIKENNVSYSRARSWSTQREHSALTIVTAVGEKHTKLPKSQHSGNNTVSKNSTVIPPLTNDPANEFFG